MDRETSGGSDATDNDPCGCVPGDDHQSDAAVRRRDHARDGLTDAAGYRTIRLSALHRPTLQSVHEAIFRALA